MPAIEVNLNGDNVWPDLLPLQIKDKLMHLPDVVWKLAALEGGMISGKVSIALRLDLPNDSVVLTETSLAAWIAATVTLRAKFPEAFEGTPLAVTDG
jgi:hypothetical protein